MCPFDLGARRRSLLPTRSCFLVSARPLLFTNESWDCLTCSLRTRRPASSLSLTCSSPYLSSVELNSAGEVFNEEYYARAQAAVDSFEEYSRRLTETDDPNAVDVISGATVAHSQFMQAAIRAISAAQGVDNDAAANRVDIPGLSDSMRDEGLDKDLGGADR